jgi:hypothetical protein
MCWLPLEVMPEDWFIAAPLDIEPFDIDPLDMAPFDIAPLFMEPEFEGWAMLELGEAMLPGDISAGALGAPVGAGAGLVVWAQASCTEAIKAAEVSQSVRMVISCIGVDFTLALRWHVG